MVRDPCLDTGSVPQGVSMFEAVKVFSATKARDRESLGQRITDWLSWEDPEIVDKWVVQSSDQEFHCLSIILFYNESA